MDLMRQMIDDLLGRDRNAETQEEARLSSKKYYDSDVCKFHLLDMCPHTLFTNTKADLGTCRRVHEHYLVDEFKKRVAAGDKHAKKDLIIYEDALYEELKQHITELERGNKRKLERLEADAQELIAPVQSTPDEKVADERKAFIRQRKSVISAQMEKLAEEGKVAESQNLMKIIEQLDNELKSIELSIQSRLAKTDRRMVLCEACGAYLSTTDDSKRTESHVSGKQHIGFIKMREKLDELKEARKNRDKEKDKDRERDRDRDRDRERDRDRDRDRERDRDRDRDRDRHREKHRDRDRDRDRR